MNATTPSLLNGMKLVSARIVEPNTGNWSAHVSVETDTELSGEIFALVSTEPFAGAVVRGAIDGGTWSGRIEGGRGGMQKEIRARGYTRATVGTVLSDIALDSKEVISPTISPAVLARPLTSWQRVRGTTQRAVADLAEKLEMNWRITRTGQIWIGQELYQPVIGLDYKQISQGANDSVTIAPQKPGVSPGDLFDGRQVSDVITSLTAESLQQNVLFKTDEKSGIAKVLERIVQRMIGRRVDFSASYPARVVMQRGDDTLDVLIDHPRWRGDGLKNVPIRLGIPGARCEVLPGARVRIHYDEQDQSKPFAALWDTKLTDVLLVEIGAGTSFVPRDDLLQLQLVKLQTEITTLKAATLAAIGANVAAAPGTNAAAMAAFTGATAVIPAPPGATACTRLKVL